jgi:hypothetical protein
MVLRSRRGCARSSRPHEVVVTAHRRTEVPSFSSLAPLGATRLMTLRWRSPVEMLALGGWTVGRVAIIRRASRTRTCRGMRAAASTVLLGRAVPSPTSAFEVTPAFRFAVACAARCRRPRASRPVAFEPGQNSNTTTPNSENGSSTSVSSTAPNTLARPDAGEDLAERGPLPDACR